MRTVAVDFDGVIHAYGRGWQDGTIYDEPVPGALDALRTLMADHAVFVHTSRNVDQVAMWLSGHGIDCSRLVDDDREFWNELGRVLVTNRKYPAVAYIDDRAIRFTDWAQAFEDLKEFT
jgi:hypothetical protein